MHIGNHAKIPNITQSTPSHPKPPLVPVEWTEYVPMLRQALLKVAWCHSRVLPHCPESGSKLCGKKQKNNHRQTFGDTSASNKSDFHHLTKGDLISVALGGKEQRKPTRCKKVTLKWSVFTHQTNLGMLPEKCMLIISPRAQQWKDEIRIYWAQFKMVINHDYALSPCG